MVLVSDFDETLYDKNYKNNIMAVNNFVKKGNTFVIATGRSLKQLQKDLDENLNFSYIICSNGSMIFDKYFNLIYRQNIGNEICHHIFDMLKQSVYVGNPLVDLGYTTTKENKSDVSSIQARIIDMNGANILKKEILKKYSNANASFSKSSIVFTDKNVSKGNSLKVLGKIIGEKPRRMYVIGDNLNDIEMCKIGIGIAMESGMDELKKVCKKVVKNVEELIDII